MLKHVQGTRSSLKAAGGRCSLAVSPDTISISSALGCSAIGSPEPALSSRASSCASLVDPHRPTSAIKVYARCLRPDIEYKTLSVSYQTTCRQVVDALLSKFRMKHRDPRLFYLTMEVGLRSGRTGLRTVLVLDEEARPAELQSCHPRGDSRFTLQMRRGGLVRVYDSVLMAGSQYKSLLISERTTADELVRLLLQCYNSLEHPESFAIHVVRPGERHGRRLHPDSFPLQDQAHWPRGDYAFYLKRDPIPQWNSAESSTGSEGSSSPSPTPPQDPGFNEYENFFYI